MLDAWVKPDIGSTTPCRLARKSEGEIKDRSKISAGKRPGGHVPQAREPMLAHSIQLYRAQAPRRERDRAHQRRLAGWDRRGG